MATTHLLTVSKILVFAVFVCCDAANVQFFWELDFKGTVYEATSSTSCKDLPVRFKNVNGSIKTTGCIAVFRNDACKINNGAFLIKSEESRLNELPWKYEEKKSSEYTVSSYRDCTDMERRPQVDFDLFAEGNFSGEVEQYRDICSCTNLRYDGTFGNRRSGQSYGDCLKLYDSTNCFGLPRYTGNIILYYRLKNTFRSIEPCHPSPAQCAVRFAAGIFSVQNKTEVSKPEMALRQIPIDDKQVFVNNGRSTIERYVESSEEIPEALHFQPSNAAQLISAITFEDSVIQDFLQTIPLHLPNQSLSAFQDFSSNGTVVRKQKLKIREKLTLPPCTKVEVMWLAEMADLEKDYEVHLKLTATLQGIKSMEAKFIPHCFEGLNFSTEHDNFTAVAKTVGKLSMNYVVTTRLNVTTEPIPECKKRLIRLKAIVTKVSPITNMSNLIQVVQKLIMNNTQIFINNGTSREEKNYEAAFEVAETGEFLFLKELNQISYLEFLNDLKIYEEPSISFIKKAWAKLKEVKIEQNEIISDDVYKYMILSNKTYRVQEKIDVHPCTKYEVESFVKIARNVEIDYKIQLRVTGQFGSDSVDMEEIRESLEGLTFLTKEDNFTGLFETTAKLRLNYRVSSGIDAVETSIRSCRSHFMKYAGNVINLERILNSSYSTGSLNVVAISPKQVFTNNGTSLQEDSYEAAKEITESAKFEFEIEMKDISFLKFEGDAKEELEKSIPFFPAVETKLAGGLSPSQSMWNTTLVFGVKNKNEFRVQKNIVVGSCTEYEVDSFIKIAENVETNYKVLLEVTAKMGADAVRAEEIRENLNDLVFIRDKDDFTVTAETTMKLKVTYGASSGVNAEGKQMLDCLAIQAELVGNCKFVCSG